MSTKYDPKELFEKAQKLVKKNKLFWFEDIIAFLPISKETFYRYYPTDSYEYDELKKLLEENRIGLKVSLRAKWHNSKAPALQMALMKLISNEDELKRLSVTYNDHTTKGKSLNEKEYDFSKLTKEEKKKYKEILLKIKSNE